MPATAKAPTATLVRACAAPRAGPERASPRRSKSIPDVEINPAVRDYDYTKNHVAWNPTQRRAIPQGLCGQVAVRTVVHEPCARHWDDGRLEKWDEHPDGIGITTVGVQASLASGSLGPKNVKPGMHGNHENRNVRCLDRSCQEERADLTKHPITSDRASDEMDDGTQHEPECLEHVALYEQHDQASNR